MGGGAEAVKRVEMGGDPILLVDFDCIPEHYTGKEQLNLMADCALTGLGDELGDSHPDVRVADD